MVALVHGYQEKLNVVILRVDKVPYNRSYINKNFILTLKNKIINIIFVKMQDFI